MTLPAFPSNLPRATNHDYIGVYEQRATSFLRSWPRGLSVKTLFEDSKFSVQLAAFSELATQIRIDEPHRGLARLFREQAPQIASVLQEALFAQVPWLDQKISIFEALIRMTRPVLGARSAFQYNSESVFRPRASDAADAANAAYDVFTAALESPERLTSSHSMTDTPLERAQMSAMAAKAFLADLKNELGLVTNNDASSLTSRLDQDRLSRSLSAVTGFLAADLFKIAPSDLQREILTVGASFIRAYPLFEQAPDALHPVLRAFFFGLGRRLAETPSLEANESFVSWLLNITTTSIIVASPLYMIFRQDPAHEQELGRLVAHFATHWDGFLEEQRGNAYTYADRLRHRQLIHSSFGNASSSSTQKPTPTQGVLQGIREGFSSQLIEFINNPHGGTRPLTWISHVIFNLADRFSTAAPQYEPLRTLAFDFLIQVVRTSSDRTTSTDALYLLRDHFNHPNLSVALSQLSNSSLHQNLTELGHLITDATLTYSLRGFGSFLIDPSDIFSFFEKGVLEDLSIPREVAVSNLARYILGASLDTPNFGSLRHSIREHLQSSFLTEAKRTLWQEALRLAETQAGEFHTKFPHAPGGFDRSVLSSFQAEITSPGRRTNRPTLPPILGTPCGSYLVSTYGALGGSPEAIAYVTNLLRGPRIH